MDNTKPFRNERFEAALKEIPLDIRIKTSLFAHIIMSNGGQLITPLTDEGEEIDPHPELTERAYKEAKELFEVVIEQVESWILDGMPNRDKNSPQTKIQQKG